MAVTAAIGGASEVIDDATVSAFVEEQIAGIDLDRRSLCVVIPDATRRCPLRLLLPAVEQAVEGRVSDCNVVVALGTHAPMSDAAIAEMVGPTALRVLNHAWWDDATFTQVGTLSARQVEELSGGRVHDDVPIRLNRLVTEADVTLIVSPVLPHEVVGFSGGNKYLFPGLSGQELIDLTHWLGALITSREIIGRPGVTPVRALIEAAAALVPGERHALCLVAATTDGHRPEALHAAIFGDTFGAWSQASTVASRTHVVHLDRPFRRVLSMVPGRYDDLWTGAKGFYKVEPVVADGGEVVIYAPHITQIARTHPGIADIGYHCRDYLLAHWDRYRDHPRGDLAHSTHLYGAGTWDAAAREERPRVTVSLATGIPRAVVESVNLTYRDPATVEEAEFTADPDALVVTDAGEVLYRLR